MLAKFACWCEYLCAPVGNGLNAKTLAAALLAYLSWVGMLILTVGWLFFLVCGL